MSRHKIVVTCEHGANHIPAGFSEYITDKTVMHTHRAYDLGAYDLYTEIAEKFADFQIVSKTCRLLIDYNRSAHNPCIFSEFAKLIPQHKKKILLKEYLEYRTKVMQFINSAHGSGFAVIHLSVHTFTPVLKGRVRNCDFGILYDPKVKEDKKFALMWKNILGQIAPGYKTRFNYPYLGISDGFVTSLRKIFKKDYIGIELEVNQKHSSNNTMTPDVKLTILKSLDELFIIS